MVDVAICIITCLRPRGLARLLASLARLEFRKNEHVSLAIVVVDNDAAGSARPVVERACASLPWPVRYDVEPQRGISFARNRAVALAGACALLAFVDDDETVEPAWLDELLDAQRRCEADLVSGPVSYLFEDDPPRWIVVGRFFERRFEYRRRPTGSSIGVASTANMLVRRQALERVPGPFDPRFALTGGSDALLTRQLARAGARMVWCDEAIVHTSLPASRITAKWILQRAYRAGMTAAQIDRALQPTPRHMALRALRGGVCLALGLAGLAPALLRGRAGAVGMLRYVARGAGTLSALVGGRFEEYRHIHGS